jgi:hypothetical protein
VGVANGWGYGRQAWGLRVEAARRLARCGSPHGARARQQSDLRWWGPAPPLRTAPAALHLLSLPCSFLPSAACAGPHPVCKGYGVPAHLEAIRTHGYCEEHRRSFQPIKAMALEGIAPAHVAVPSARRAASSLLPAGAAAVAAGVAAAGRSGSCPLPATGAAGSAGGSSGLVALGVEDKGSVMESYDEETPALPGGARPRGASALTGPAVDANGGAPKVQQPAVRRRGRPPKAGGAAAAATGAAAAVAAVAGTAAPPVAAAPDARKAPRGRGQRVAKDADIK